MAEAWLPAVVFNAALLVAAVQIVGLIVPRVRASIVRHLLAGALFGGVGIGVMMAPFTLQAGIVFDLRSVLIGLVGLFAGALPTAVAAAMTVAYRLTMGGAGTAMGVSVILAAAAIGLLWRRRGRASSGGITATGLLALGVVVHLAMLALTALLPRDAALVTLRQIAVPVLLVYPLATVALGLLFRRRLEQERLAHDLEAAEARHRALFDNEYTAILVIDQADLRVVEANAAAVRYYGWPATVLTSMTMSQIDTLLDEAYRTPFDGDATPAGQRLESRHRRADGSERDVEVLTVPIRTDDRLLLYAFVADVTTRKRAETELAASEARRAEELAAAVEAQRRGRLAALNIADDARAAQRRLELALAEVREKEAWLIASQRAGRVASWTVALPRGELTWSDTVTEVLGVDDLDLATFLGHVHPDDAPAMDAWFEDMVAGERRGELTVRWMAPDGSVRHVSGSGELAVDAEGQPVTMTGTIQDITERVLAEAKLRQLSAAVEQSPESIVITDTDARIEYVNDAFLSSTGYGRDELIGQNPRLLNAGRTPVSSYRDMWSALSAGRPWKGEFVNRRKDGSEYTEFALVSPLADATGRVTHYLAVKEDITEKKQVAEELDRYRHHLEELVATRTVQLAEERTRAEAANAAKTAFLANISHEIRTPMNAIVGLSHLLLRAEPTPTQHERLEKIDRAARHLLSIINDVLDLAKIEAGKVAAAHEDFHLSEVLDHVHSVIAESARAKGIAVTVERHGVPPWLRGDAPRLRQALLNLAGNAVKFTDRGAVTLRARLLEEGAAGLRVRFEVQDTGIGIDADVIPLIFDAFVQSKATAARRRGGTGLGLTITRSLAELMGGEVGIERPPAGGTLVWFDVTLRRGMTPSTPPGDAGERRPPQGFGGARLLLAEDNAINREVMVELLQLAGLDVETADTGLAAIRRAREVRYDLVLMDVQMPELDGIAATRAIRELPGYADVPILALTATVFEDDRRACLAAGMNDFLSKPIDPDLLVRTLARWLTDAPAAHDREPSVSGPGSAASGARTISALPALPDGWAVPRVLDADRGVAALGGDARAYVALLRRFVMAHQHDATRLRADLADGDFHALSTHAHAVRGVAATLGATEVASAAGALEGLGPDHEGAAAAIDELARAQAVLGALVTSAADPSLPAATEPPPAGTATELGDVLGRLEGLLSSDDTEAIELFALHKGSLLVGLGIDALRIGAQLDAFDLPAALATVRGARERLAAGAA